MRKPTPNAAEQYHRDLVAKAVRFDVSLFLGTGQFARATADTIAEARAQAARLKVDHPTCTRLPLIYGITADGRSGLVTD